MDKDLTKKWLKMKSQGSAWPINSWIPHPIVTNLIVAVRRHKDGSTDQIIVPTDNIAYISEPVSGPDIKS